MIGERLRAERERLKMTQSAFAAAAGAAKRTLIEWEKGATSPNAVQLAALSQAGVDVRFVVTGVRDCQPIQGGYPDQQPAYGVVEESRANFILDEAHSCRPDQVTPEMRANLLRELAAALPISDDARERLCVGVTGAPKKDADLLADILKEGEQADPRWPQVMEWVYDALNARNRRMSNGRKLRELVDAVMVVLQVEQGEQDDANVRRKIEAIL